MLSRCLNGHTAPYPRSSERLQHSASSLSERRSTAVELNEKQFEETGTNLRQAPAGCHKERGCLSSFPLEPSALTPWADERSMGRLGSRFCGCCLPLHQEVSQLQNAWKEKKRKEERQNCKCEWLERMLHALLSSQPDLLGNTVF